MLATLYTYIVPPHVPASSAYLDIGEWSEMGANFDLIDVPFSAALSSGGFSGFAPFFGNTHKIVQKA